LVRRIEAIAAKRKSITLKNLDAEKFVLEYLPTVPKNSLVYCDPPYYHKSKRLYLNDYKPEDHVRMAKIVQQKIKQHWVVSYDDAPEISKCYSKRKSFSYKLPYHAADAYEGIELFFLSDSLELPSKSVVRRISEALQALP
jgi:DNA adenine methylase